MNIRSSTATQASTDWRSRQSARSSPKCSEESSRRSTQRSNSPVLSHNQGRTYLFSEEDAMAKAYWITCYRSISDPDALAAYAKLAGPAIQAAGGKFLVRGSPAKTYEAGLNQRTVVTEWASVAAAVAGHDSAGYKEALRALGGAAERDVRIVEAAA